MDVQNRGLAHSALLLFCIVFALWHVATNMFLNEPDRWQNAIHFAGFGFLASVCFPSSKLFFQGRRTFLFDIVMGLLIAFSTLWIAAAENGISARTLEKTGLQWLFGFLDWAAGIIAVVACIKLTRRLTGWIIPILIIVSLSYVTFLGEMMLGAFRAASLPISDVLFRSLYNDEGMFGIIASISSGNITLFMIFGAYLVVSGASDFVIEASRVGASRFRGGAAFVAVISSALTGTISGSAIANTASTGIITIPMMKSSGFREQFAGGVEASPFR